MGEGYAFSCTLPTPFEPFFFLVAYATDCAIQGVHSGGALQQGRAEVATGRRWWQNSALCEYYARAAAAVLVSVGLAGITGVLSWQFPSGVYHVAVGVFFVYVGFFVPDPETVRQMVGGLGVLLLVVKIVTILVPLLWQEHLYWGVIEVTCVVVGITSILAARYLRFPSQHRERVR